MTSRDCREPHDAGVIPLRLIDRGLLYIRLWAGAPRSRQLDSAFIQEPSIFSCNLAYRPNRAQNLPCCDHLYLRPEMHRIAGRIHENLVDSPGRRL
jgi:hypothetical protein